MKPSFYNTIFKYKHSIVQDLAWLIISPPIVQFSDNWNRTIHQYNIHSCLRLFIQEAETLAKFDREPKLLSDIVGEEYKLGLYAEKLLLALFTYSPNYDVLFSNKVIYKNKISIGEFDYLLKEKNSSQYLHIELSVKYYMATGDYSKEELFIGPNSTDNLYKKNQKLLQKQLRLLETPSGKEFLRTIKIESNQIKPILFYKGYIFSQNKDVYKNTVISPFHNSGKWTHKSRLESYLKEESRYRILLKKQWMTPQHDLHKGKVINKYELQSKLPLEFNSILISVLNKNKNSGLYDEEYKIMIVNDQWPN